MRTTVEEIEKIVREEVERLAELNPWHSKSGKFAKRGTEKTYSLSKRAVADNGVSQRYALKGEKTGDYDTDNPSASVTTRTGSDKGPRTAGRQDIDGRKVPIRYSLGDYDKRYDELKEFIDGMTGKSESKPHRAVPEAVLDGIIQALVPYLDGAGFDETPGPI